MTSQIFVNLPVKDLKRSVDFFTATAAGAATPMPPQDHGFMYQHGFEDLDGHQWEFFYMESAPPAA